MLRRPPPRATTFPAAFRVRLPRQHLGRHLRINARPVHLASVQTADSRPGSNRESPSAVSRRMSNRQQQVVLRVDAAPSRHLRTTSIRVATQDQPVHGASATSRGRPTRPPASRAVPDASAGRLQSEVVRRGHQPAAEVLLPDAVDHDARGERIVGRAIHSARARRRPLLEPASGGRISGAVRPSTAGTPARRHRRGLRIAAQQDCVAGASDPVP